MVERFINRYRRLGGKCYFPAIPEMNGLQLARQLKAREPALPIFMLTAHYDVNIEKEALALGITAVFSKLDDLTTLIANARAVCGLE
jgi:DNA-binding NarL/FixJ family response regulator